VKKKQAPTYLDPQPSRARLDPWLALTAAILKQATADLKSRDPVQSLDALAFWMSPTAQEMVDALGWEIELENHFDRLIEVTHGKTTGLRPARFAAASYSANV
jgi:hypothetical protein